MKLTIYEFLRIKIKSKHLVDYILSLSSNDFIFESIDRLIYNNVLPYFIPGKPYYYDIFLKKFKTNYNNYSYALSNLLYICFNQKNKGFSYIYNEYFPLIIDKMKILHIGRAICGKLNHNYVGSRLSSIPFDDIKNIIKINNKYELYERCYQFSN